LDSLTPPKKALVTLSCAARLMRQPPILLSNSG
jgi:hypothetical protein